MEYFGYITNEIQKFERNVKTDYISVKTSKSSNCSTPKTWCEAFERRKLFELAYSVKCQRKAEQCCVGAFNVLK